MTREEAARLLRDTVASTESPDYNVMYGGSRFDDYSRHPGKYHRIQSGPNKGKKSSAAGRYQYLKGTWDEWSKKAGVNDFRPESQDKVFDMHSADVYKRKTGRDVLDDIIAAGGVTPDILKPLARTWTSLPTGIEQNRRYGYASSEPSRLEPRVMNSGGQEMNDETWKYGDPRKLGEQFQYDDMQRILGQYAKTPSMNGMTAAHPLQFLVSGMGGYMRNKRAKEREELMGDTMQRYHDAKYGGNPEADALRETQMVPPEPNTGIATSPLPPPEVNEAQPADLGAAIPTGEGIDTSFTPVQGSQDEQSGGEWVGPQRSPYMSDNSIPPPGGMDFNRPQMSPYTDPYSQQLAMALRNFGG